MLHQKKAGTYWRRATLAGIILVGLALVAVLNRLSSSALATRTQGAGAKQEEANDTFLGRPEGVIDYFQNPDEAKELVGRLARETGGDFSKLSAGHQRMLNAMAAGHGADMLRDRAISLNPTALNSARKP